MTATVGDRRDTEGVVGERVSFESEGAVLAGDLYRPSSAAPGERLPGLVVTGSWTTVRQQMASLYARRLAARGYAALCFDFRHWGESEGEPRELEALGRKAADIGAAVGFLAARGDVDPERIGAVAVCASSGYTAANAAGDERVRSVVLIAPWLHDGALVEQIYGGADGVRTRIEQGESEAARFEREGETAHVPAASAEDESAAMYGPFDYYLDPERGRIPEWSGRFAVMSWPGWLRYDAVSLAAGVHQPVLLVHSEQAALPDGAKRFAAGLAGPARFEWLDGDQFSFYDQEPNVSRAVELADEHLSATLGDGEAGR